MEFLAFGGRSSGALKSTRRRPEPRNDRGLWSRAMSAVQETVARVREIDVDKYKYGFFTDIESVRAPKGLSEDVVRFISAKKNEPLWLLDWRLEAYRRWLTMQEPTWANVVHPKIDYQELYYYSAPQSNEGPKSLADV